MRAQSSDPLRQTTLKDGTNYPYVLLNRRVGRPKETWADKALEQLWEEVRCSMPVWRNTPLNLDREDIRHQLKEYARIVVVAAAGILRSVMEPGG